MKNHYLVLKALTNCTSNITYHIYGPVKDQAYWKSCLQLIDELPANINVIYHGDVLPEKVEGVLSQTHVYIQPSKSENFGHSIFEALSIGRPVITSHNTLWNDLENLQAGLNVLPANTIDISNAIDFFSRMHDEELLVWSKGACRYAASAIDVESIGNQYLTMFNVNHNN
jgi:glycosyltransferase involved in cell wall biosynthesis